MVYLVSMVEGLQWSGNCGATRAASERPFARRRVARSAVESTTAPKIAAAPAPAASVVAG